MFCRGSRGCRGDELTPLPRPGRDGSGRGGLWTGGGQGTGRQRPSHGTGRRKCRPGPLLLTISSPGPVSIRVRAATQELPARPRPEAALGGRREAPVTGPRGHRG